MADCLNWEGRKEVFGHDETEDEELVEDDGGVEKLGAIFWRAIAGKICETVNIICPRSVIQISSINI